MFFYLAKIGWFILQPVSLVALLLVLSLLSLLLHWPRLSGALVALSLLLLLLCAYTSLGYVLIAPLEARFVRPAEMPAKVDGIVVLGGGMDANVNNARHGWELNRDGDRFVEALRLAELYPQAKVLVTGGFGVLMHGTDTEAAAGARFFRAFGIPDSRLLLDEEARNTEENAVNAKAVAKPQPGETWLLVTSAFHMPRSVGLFRTAGFDVVPWPTDYLGSGDRGFGLKIDEPVENLAITQVAIREWIGLAAYAMTGKIAEVFPGPAPPH